jgi:hydrogenase/urease accessory protein HupE
MIKRITALLLVLLSGILMTSATQAHIFPAQNATLNIEGNAAFFVVSVPVSALSGIDEDGNGRLSSSDLRQKDAEIIAQFNKRFRVLVDGKPGKISLVRIVPPESETEVVDTNYVVIMQRIDFPAVPDKPVLTTDLFGTMADEGNMTITATSGDTSELVILKAGNNTHQFFKGGFATFIDFIKIGIDHILGGTDHLLFLLTIIVAAAGWRYWLVVVTSFTVAHSITLTLSALGIASIPPAIVEPSIAASIVAMAALNLWRGATLEKNAQWVQIMIVFACGLLHGFGFASAIGEMGIDANNRLATLAGFNIGVELGQFLFLCGVLLIMILTKRFLSPRIAHMIPRAASAIAGLFGIIFLIDRVSPLF